MSDEEKGGATVRVDVDRLVQMLEKTYGADLCATDPAPGWERILTAKQISDLVRELEDVLARVARLEAAMTSKVQLVTRNAEGFINHIQTFGPAESRHTRVEQRVTESRVPATAATGEGGREIRVERRITV